MFQKIHSKKAGFTLIEVMVITAIITIIATMALLQTNSVLENAKITKSVSVQQNMTVAAELYAKDMGFYPPDVNRGWDPGLSQSLPNNPDEGQSTPGTDCSHCPVDWEDIVAEKWKGPYLSVWPSLTAWGGKYDYNYWPEETTRYGCVLPPGVYLGIQGDYDNDHTISEISEERMVDRGNDYDGCLNGESQMILRLLDE